ncbi:RNA polymerase sigma factor [Actinokineospora auranticolor]|uniref:RNA polymerase sigma-70 factor (ECF subfamily) n=1 Tax=Actinokineospora auranticolor TaxID=155976 RepID=A0A2S6GI58_9PSEU|nr:RNA polymerase sigma factor [Actinokineospora auranticolor]PPK64895.1 RNA polymerase sigma-70 factor (ECF subfamily) [Actinokineospora auranticolor]
MTDPDAAVLAAIADDLDAGFAELVRTHQRVVLSVALRVGGRDAEDLAAECFLRAYHALRGYDRSRILALRPRSWLLTILLNTWRNTVRAASRRPVVAVAELPERATAGPSVEQQVADAETRGELAALVSTLPENQRVAVVLRHVVDLPVAEIAAVMAAPEGTVKSHISRGLARLREQYAKEVVR